MRPPGGILTPGESILATGNSCLSSLLTLISNIFASFSFTDDLKLSCLRVFVSLFFVFILNVVFKFVEPPVKGEKMLGRKSRVKFKIMSLKVEPGMDYIPELVNCIQRVFINPSI